MAARRAGTRWKERWTQSASARDPKSWPRFARRDNRAVTFLAYTPHGSLARGLSRNPHHCLTPRSSNPHFPPTVTVPTSPCSQTAYRTTHTPTSAPWLPCPALALPIHPTFHAHASLCPSLLSYCAHHLPGTLLSPTLFSHATHRAGCRSPTRWFPLRVRSSRVGPSKNELCDSRRRLADLVNQTSLHHDCRRRYPPTPSAGSRARSQSEKWVVSRLE